MAKSKAVSVDVLPIGENFKYVKYTYVYIHNEDAKRKIVRDNETFRGYHQIGKSKFSSVPFPDGTGGFWYAEMMYQKDSDQGRKVTKEELDDLINEILPKKNLAETAVVG